MATKKDAKEAVVGIGKRYGFIDLDIMNRIQQWDPEVRRTIEESMLAKDRLAAHSITTLAKNIYGSDARFVFELLQNADDNSFTRARASGDLPFVSFHVHPDRIIVECNEDGFTKRDLTAICAVGESTKSTSHGYIGAKGIGFKSVFIAAWKVYIQSGHFSFYFKHERGELGLGMVLPIWKEADEDLHGPLTRMTLHLHEKGDQRELEHLRQTIFKQLADLQQTCLLFLRNLKKIEVSFYNQEGKLESSRRFHVGGVTNHDVFLEAALKNANGNVTTERKHYHVTRYMATNLPRSDNRDAPDTEEARRASSVAEVILAFPLTNDSVPLIEKQEIFAFLPVRQSDFNFLIQSDFDTSANRQDIVTTSRRNVELLGAIGEAFMRAVLQFCEHPDLCYTWPWFLPSPDHGSSTFWAGLNAKIRQLMFQTPVLKARHRNDLRKIVDVVMLASNFQDNDGNPLFDDILSDPFLSKAYLERSKSTLKPYGLQVMNFNLALDLLRVDLRSPISKLRSTSMSEDWHSAAAEMMTTLVRNGRSTQMKELSLLPLRSGQWVAPSSGQAYLPTTSGIPIPPGVDIRILDRDAVANENRRRLFIELGVLEPSFPEVRASILRAYSSSTRRVGTAESRAHLHFLYLTHQSQQPRHELMGIYIYNRDGSVGNPNQGDFYLLGDHSHPHPYGPEELLGPTSGVPGYPVAFVHPTYLQEIPSLTNPRHPSWKVWLRDYIGVRERLRLVSRDGTSLSDTWTYVAEHRPEKLLGMLEYLWRYEGSHVSGNEFLKASIKRTSGNKLCERELPRQCNLTETFLPLSNLRQKCRRYMEISERFPFLEFETIETDEELRTKWMFLHREFSVGMNDDNSFLLCILHWIKNKHPRASSITRCQRILGLYAAIYANRVGLFTRQADVDSIRSSFEDFCYVFAPAQRGHDARWVRPSECLWDAPPDMISKCSLKHLYEPILSRDHATLLPQFFQQILSIPEASWTDLTKELEQLRDSHCEDFDHILSIYEYLSEMNLIAPVELKVEFAVKDLIFVVKGGRCSWHKAHECLWSSTTEIQGKVTLNDNYEELRDFFVDTLGVKTLNLQMVYDELLHTSRQMTINEVKSTIWSFNALLQTEQDRLDPRPLLEARVFPVKFPDGTKALTSTGTAFAIADRDYLDSLFKDRIRVLDYSLPEVRLLKPFFEWAGLTSRFLSACVKEITSVADGRRRPISLPNRDLKPKAHALLRIAATFNSPRYKADPAELYHLLRTVQTIATNDISSVLSVSQDGQRTEVRREIGDMHISESPAGLTVYVPLNRKKQEFCFGSPLPANLEDWLMRDPTTQIRDKVDEAAVTVLTTVLSVNRSVINLILDHHGIIEVSIPNEDEGGDETDDEDEQYGTDDEDEQHGTDDEDEQYGTDNEQTTDLGDDNATLSLGAVTPDSSTNGGLARAAEAVVLPTTEIYRPSSSFSWEQATARQSRFPSQPVSGSSRIATVFSPQLHTSSEEIQYWELLSRVIEAARRATFPSRGPFDMAGLSAALGGGISFDGFDGFDHGNRFRSATQLERDKKIGAAGELYVFELLSRLDPALPQWGRANWQSTIRRYVRVHPDYADMDNWDGRETADITYEDTEGELTAMLVDRGHLDSNGWRNSRPKYYIEVKTTTGPCRTPFYMSKYQYQRMRDVHYTNDHSAVYMILRVFEIESARIGMRVYLDPEQLRLDERLEFTGETWSVVPT